MPAGVQVWLLVDSGECLKGNLAQYVVCSVGMLGSSSWVLCTSTFYLLGTLFLDVTVFEAEIKFGEQIL